LDYAKQAPWLAGSPYKHGDGCQLAADILARPVTHAVLLDKDQMYFACEDPHGLLTYSLTRCVPQSGQQHVAVEVCPYARMAAAGMACGETLLRSDRALARGMAIAAKSLAELARGGSEDLGVLCGLEGGAGSWAADALGSELRLLTAQDKYNEGPQYLPAFNLDALCRKWESHPPSVGGDWRLGRHERSAAEQFLRLFGMGSTRSFSDPYVAQGYYKVPLRGTTRVGGKALPAMKLVAERLAATFTPSEPPLAARTHGYGQGACLEVYTRSSKSWSVRGCGYSKPRHYGSLAAARESLSDTAVSQFVAALVDSERDGKVTLPGVVLLGDVRAAELRIAQWAARERLGTM
jgi:hypothetical protein